MNITIIANGLFPNGDWVDELLLRADSVVCCDGALENYLFWTSRHPVAICNVTVVGDGDSLTPDLLTQAMRQGLEVSHLVVAEQEYNDLTKATRHAVATAREKGFADDHIHIDYIGATGLREDHTVGNISLLAYYLETYPRISFRMVSDYGTFYPVCGHRRFASRRGQEVSIFSLTPQVPVSAYGLQYPLDESPLTAWWQGTLNVALGDSFEVWGGMVVVYLCAV